MVAVIIPHNVRVTASPQIQTHQNDCFPQEERSARRQTRHSPTRL